MPHRQSPGGIVVTNVPAYSTKSVAQFTFALLLELTQHVGDHSRGVREGNGGGQRTSLIGKTRLSKLVHSRSGGVDLTTLFRDSDESALSAHRADPTSRQCRAAAVADEANRLSHQYRSRPVVNEADLAAALNAGRIAGAAVDVLSAEPPPATNPLLMARNCIITPHFGWATTAARRRLLQVVVANIRAFFAGRPQHVVVV